MGNRRIILELDREPQDLQAVWRLDSIARLIQQALITHRLSGANFSSNGTVKFSGVVRFISDCMYTMILVSARVLTDLT